MLKEIHKRHHKATQLFRFKRVLMFIFHRISNKAQKIFPQVYFWARIWVNKYRPLVFLRLAFVYAPDRVIIITFFFFLGGSF